MNSSFSGEKCLITDTSNYYRINDTSRFSFRVTHFENAITIDFLHKYDTDSLNDGATIEYCLNNGEDWNNAIWLYDACFNSYSFPEIDSISAGNTMGLTGRKSDWTSFHMDLAFETDCFPGADPYDTVTIRFSFFSDGIQNNKEGWAIDNLSIGWYRVGIEELKNKEIVIYIYPMPISEESVLFIDHSYSKKSYIKVYNVWGNLLFEENLDSYNFPIGKDLNNLKKGIYILKYQNQTGITLSKKIIK